MPPFGGDDPPPQCSRVHTAAMGTGQGCAYPQGGGASKGQVWTRHLAPSRACLHTPFIAFSVPMRVGHCHCPRAQCAPPVPPWRGEETRACWFWALSPGHAVGVLRVGAWGAGGRGAGVIWRTRPPQVKPPPHPNPKKFYCLQQCTSKRG